MKKILCFDARCVLFTVGICELQKVTDGPGWVVFVVGAGFIIHLLLCAVAAEDVNGDKWSWF